MLLTLRQHTVGHSSWHWQVGTWSNQKPTNPHTKFLHCSIFTLKATRGMNKSFFSHVSMQYEQYPVTHTLLEPVVPMHSQCVPSVLVSSALAPRWAYVTCSCWIVHSGKRRGEPAPRQLPPAGGGVPAVTQRDMTAGGATAVAAGCWLDVVKGATANTTQLGPAGGQMRGDNADCNYVLIPRPPLPSATGQPKQTLNHLVAMQTWEAKLSGH